MAEDEIQGRACGGFDRPLLKTYKSDNSGKEYSNYGCRHLPQPLDIFLRKTGQGAHQQQLTIGVYVVQDNLQRPGDCAVSNNGISPTLHWLVRTIQRYNRFETKSLRLGTSTRPENFYNTAHRRVQHTGAQIHKAARFGFLQCQQPCTLESRTQQPIPPTSTKPTLGWR